MKIDLAIMSSNDDPMYLDFWPVVSRQWKEKLGVDPVLLYFGTGNPSEEYGIVVNMGTDYENIPLATCWARYWYPSLYSDKVSIITDIDMIPLSRQYFIDQIKDFPDSAYIHLNPCIETYTRLPSCYHVAKGSTFKELLKLHDSFRDSYNNLLSHYFDNSTCYVKGGNEKWCYDEYYATSVLMKQRDRIALMPREGGESGRRIDRTNWIYDNQLLSEGYYFDSHSLRPYSKYKEEIDKLMHF